MRSRQLVRNCQVLTASVLFAIALAAVAHAQESKGGASGLPEYKDEKQEKLDRTNAIQQEDKVSKMRADGKFDGEAELNAMKDYYLLQFKRWTYDCNRTEIPKLRRVFQKDFREAYEKSAKDAHTAMNEFFLAEMQKRAADEKLDYVIRYNAMLQLGELNAAEMTKIGGGTEAPLPAAVPVLLQSYQDPKSHAAVRTAALVGLLRHARLGIADEGPRKQVQTALFALLQEEQPPENVDEDAHVYLRRRAAQGLGWLGAAGTTNGGSQVYDALLAIVKDDKQPMLFRSDAARAIGDLRLQGVGGVQIPELVQTLGGLALEVIESGGDDVLDVGEFDKLPDEKARPLLLYLKSVRWTLRGPDPETAPGGLARLDAGEKTNKLIQDLGISLDELPYAEKEKRTKVVVPIKDKVARIRDLLAGKTAAEGEDAATEAAEGDAAEGETAGEAETGDAADKSGE